jgi:hypothetical protein
MVTTELKKAAIEFLGNIYYCNQWLLYDADTCICSCQLIGDAVSSWSYLTWNVHAVL